jgi:ketosteroid isomerase-like protein
MQPNHKALIEQAYTAFNRRDIDAALSLMTPDVEWPNGWEGGYVQGHQGVRTYWTRQWKEIDPTVRPLAIVERPDGRIEVAVQQTVKDLQGHLLFDGPVTHIYTLEHGKVKHMEIEKP